MRENTQLLSFFFFSTKPGRNAFISILHWKDQVEEDGRGQYPEGGARYLLGTVWRGGLLQPGEQNKELGKNRSGCFSLLSFRSFPEFSDVRKWSTEADRLHFTRPRQPIWRERVPNLSLGWRCMHLEGPRDRYMYIHTYMCSYQEVTLHHVCVCVRLEAGGWVVLITKYIVSAGGPEGSGWGWPLWVGAIAPSTWHNSSWPKAITLYPWPNSVHSGGKGYQLPCRQGIKRKQWI